MEAIAACLSDLKTYFLALYFAFGILCLVMTIRYHRSGPVTMLAAKGGRTVLSVLPPVIAASLLLAVFVVTGSHLLLAAVAIGTAIFAVRHAVWRAPLDLLLAGAAATLVLSLVWWRIAPEAAAPLPLAVFAVILGGLLFGFADGPGGRPDPPVLPVVVFLVAGLLLLIDLAEYRAGTTSLLFLAHHWGAFIGPVLHVKAGLVPFHDMPMQYGLGPTLVIAVACRGTDCWAGMEAVVVLTDLAQALLILRMALATRTPRGWLWHWTATLVVFAAVCLWPGDLSDGNILLADPSVGAMRFLPTTLVACLLFFGRPAVATAALVPAVLWSPESAAMSVAVFGLCETARIGFPGALRRAAGVLLGAGATLVLLHRAIFGVWIDPAAFAEYVLHVPGPLPIFPISDALLLAAMLGIGFRLVARAPADPVVARRDRAATFLLFAAASYWFGRSHPDNICNLAPFLALVGFRVLDRPGGEGSRLADITGFGLATSVAALAMSPWLARPYGLPAIVDIHAVVADFPSLEPDIGPIRERIVHPDGPGIADFGPAYLRHPSEQVIWTPMDPSSLWSFVPSERRRIYIRRSAARLRRSGWAIVDDDQRFLLDDLLAGYVVAQRHDVEAPPSLPGGAPTRYVVVCFNPRPEIAAPVVGPACPSASAIMPPRPRPASALAAESAGLAARPD